MRMFKKGEPFMDVRCEVPVDDGDFGQWHPPVFSEAHLYNCMHKDDARFVLGVAEEYDHIIKVLGSDKVRQLLTQGS